MQTSSPLPVVLALTRLIDGLFEVIVTRYGKFPIGGTLSLYIWRKFEAAKTRFGRLAARFAAGKIFRARPARPAGARGPRKKPDDDRPPITRLIIPNFGWLVRVAPDTADFARQLEALLTADTDMAALLAATPATARVLRSVCWMLGVCLPAPPCAEDAGTQASAEIVADARAAPVPGTPAADRPTTPPAVMTAPLVGITNTPLAAMTATPLAAMTATPLDGTKGHGGGP